MNSFCEKLTRHTPAPSLPRRLTASALVQAQDVPPPRRPPPPPRSSWSAASAASPPRGSAPRSRRTRSGQGPSAADPSPAASSSPRMAASPPRPRRGNRPQRPVPSSCAPALPVGSLPAAIVFLSADVTSRPFRLLLPQRPMPAGRGGGGRAGAGRARPAARRGRAGLQAAAAGAGARLGGGRRMSTCRWRTGAWRSSRRCSGGRLPRARSGSGWPAATRPSRRACSSVLPCWWCLG
ncbi:hypothetical protein BS78_07G211100 [Paspalum vaginatum]|nr:hypothetical protein BS78_07G211100 [Paspalum vaginatum]